MSTLRLTKIVSVCLIVTLAACSEKDAPKRKSSAVGSQSKIGKQLTTGTWCKPSRVGNEGQIRQEKIVFSSNGEITMTDYLLHDDSSLKAETQAVGTWSVLDTRLIIMQEQQEALPSQVSPATREEDGAKCFSLTSVRDENSSTEQICPCN